MPFATRRRLSSLPTTVSSNVSVKLPDSPQNVGSGSAATVVITAATCTVAVGVASTRFASAGADPSPSSKTVVTTVLNRLSPDEKGVKEGGAERGVCRFVLVVRDRV